ncbi:hypothetical protein P4O66_022270, partial [Electrophorus voltai]
EGHTERISFFLLPGPSHSLTLDLPWLRAHNPQMSWAKNQILQGAPSCHRRCFPNKAAPLQATSVESPDADRRVPIPSEYQDLGQVFSPSKAMLLPRHRDWDCDITLKEGEVPPRCRIYPLSQEEERAMQQYITEALQQGYIRPSTSPASAGVFFVMKRDGGLRPCVDYQGLNKLLVQYPYPLPLAYVNEVLREFLGRSIVAYIDDILIYSPSRNQHVSDVRAVLQTLLGKCEFHRREVDFLGRFIRSFSSLARPLTDQFRGPVKKIKWTQEVNKAFEELKNAFATAPVLQQPFMLEQRGTTGFGDSELLAIKLTFEQWRHWVEGARHPFTVYTEHKNLEYLQTTKRLNGRQARWSIFFSWFQFKVTYRPGEKHTRADELSRQYTAEARSASSEPVLLPTCFLTSLEWELDRQIKAANPHPQCPANHLYVPPARRGALITWARTSGSSRRSPHTAKRPGYLRQGNSTLCLRATDHGPTWQWTL